MGVSHFETRAAPTVASPRQDSNVPSSASWQLPPGFSTAHLSNAHESADGTGAMLGTASLQTSVQVLPFSIAVRCMHCSSSEILQ